LYGIIKLENHLPKIKYDYIEQTEEDSSEDEEKDSFNQYDTEIVAEFAKQFIVPAIKGLLGVRSGGSRDSAGYKRLVQKVGPSEKLKGQKLTDRLKEMISLRNKDKGITAWDCASFLQISKQQYYRLLRELSDNDAKR